MPHVDCWTSRAVSTSARSARCSPTRKPSSWQVWCRGALAPWNISPSCIVPQVRLFQFAWPPSTSLPFADLGIPRIALFDLSDATKLQHLTFSGTRTGSTVRWITTTLKTIKSKNIQSIVIKPTDDLLESVSEGIRQEWHDLDRLLVQLCITHSIRPRVICEVRNEGKVGPGLLPELTKRGMVDLIETVVGGAGTVVSSLCVSSCVLIVLVFGQLKGWETLEYVNTWCKSRHASV